MDTDTPGRRPRRVWLKLVLVCVLALLAVVALRSALVTSAVIIHNDERHYALDGFWVKSGLPPAAIWNVLLRGHMHPHPLYNPLTGKLKPHGEFTRGFSRGDDDLATFPRAGHPALFMTLLGPLFAFFSKSWLLRADHYVLLARMVNTLLDCLTWLMLYQLLRDLFGRRISLWVVLPAALLPYVLVIGSLGYLDGPGTFMIVLGAWFWFRFMHRQASPWRGVVLGLLLGAGILMKQSNVFAIPLLAAAVWCRPPRRRARELVLPLALAAAVVAATVLVGCKPLDLVTKTMDTVERTSRYGANRHVASDGTRRITYLFDAAGHYHFGSTPGKPKSFVQSRALILAHSITFPLLLAVFLLSVIVLLLLRRWRCLALPLVIIGIATVIPVGTCVRRLYLLLPFALFTIALAVWELQRRKRSFTSG